MVPCVCSVIDHRGRQNVVRTSVTHSAALRVPLFVLTTFWRHPWSITEQTHGNMESICYYIITQVILAFWLVITYDLLEDRRIDDDSARFKFFWILNLNQSQFFAKHSNQSVRFILYRHKITSVLFRACQSGEIWNKNNNFIIFTYILIFYYIKQIDSMLPCVCSVIDHRERQNVVRTSVTHSAALRMPLFCSYHILTSSVIYYWKKKTE